MSILNKIGKRHLELGLKWLPSGAIYGATAFCAMLYFTDWKVITKKIPLYNMKYDREE